MSSARTRRDFLKLSAAGLAAGAATESLPAWASVSSANPGAEGPGPLVALIAKTVGSFPVPVMIVPGDLADADIDALS